MTGISNPKLIIILFVLSAGLLLAGHTHAAADANTPAASIALPAKNSLLSEPLVSPKALLIRDEAIRNHLALDAEAIKKVNIMCDRLDPLLFAMRDVPAESKDPTALQHAAAIQRELKALFEILTPAQRTRLEELAIQYHGFAALFWPIVAEHLRLSDNQLQRINKIFTDTRGRLEGLKQKEPSQDKQLTAKEYQHILLLQEQEISSVFALTQQIRWQKLLGKQFDFSVLKPLVFRAPELTDVTTWINSRPLTLSDLSGKVVIVHFWTFGCANCINNYPAYKRWLEKYNSAPVVMIGIHTPETVTEESVNKITSKAQEHGLKFAIAVDNSKANWNAWSNNIWPAVYLVDKKGKVRFWWYGELNWQGAKGEQWMTDNIDMLLRE